MRPTRTASLLAFARAWLLMGLAAVSATAAANADATAINTLLQEAAEKNTHGDSKEAIELAEEVLDLDPDRVQAAEAAFQIGIGWFDQAKPDQPGDQWSRRKLDRAEKALRKAAPAGPRALDARAYLGYLLAIKEARIARHRPSVYQACLRLARERFDAGSPGQGMDIARTVLCGSTDCDPIRPIAFGDSEAFRLKDAPAMEGADERSVEPPKKSHAPPIDISGLTTYGIRGRLVLEMTIDKTGNVRDVQVLKGLPFGINEAAVEAVEQWRFEPAKVDDEPVKTSYTLTVNV